MIEISIVICLALYLFIMKYVAVLQAEALELKTHHKRRELLLVKSLDLLERSSNKEISDEEYIELASSHIPDLEAESKNDVFKNLADGHRKLIKLRKEYIRIEDEELNRTSNC